ncbi:nucleotidyltransferase family protein [Labilibacter marinus]|uniref:nucleotidyltransferase family protein n=1 Tax=Labilibacter marinus TaxID=1477105 RepID=UPI00094F6785|nr:nucleotidyltransferase family protein [Labilibacter marinus]
MTDISKYIISPAASIHDALVKLNKLSDDVLTLFVVNEAEKMVGTLTDGDIRRHLIAGIDIQDPVETVMCDHFKFIRDGDMNVAEIKKCRNLNIGLLPCLNNDNEIIRVINLKKHKTRLPIDAVLMAGGKGERLRPLTQNTPKPLLKIGNKAIIDINIDSLLTHGLEHIHVTVNYLKEQLEQHFKEPRNNTTIQCIRENNYLGTIGAVKNIPSFNNPTVLVMNSDLFTNIDYEDFFIHFTENDADISVAAVPYTVNIPYGIFNLDGRNITGLKEKPSHNYYANAGIYLIKAELLNMVPKDTFYNATDFLELMIEKGHKVIRYPITGHWIDIGKHEDYKKAQDLAKHIDNGYK